MPTPSRPTLERAFDRAPRFLRAIGRHPEIATALADVGYTAADHDEGWSLLQKAGGYWRGEPPRIVRTTPSADALAELDAWSGQGFLLAHAALERRHPKQAAFVFGGSEASMGTDRVIGTRIFLERLAALADDSARATTREADAAALATLAARGIDAAERARLAELVRVASTVAPAVPVVAPDNLASDAALVDLYAWYREWSRTARLVIKSRRLLIYLGLATRKRRAADDDDAVEA